MRGKILAWAASAAMVVSGTAFAASDANQGALAGGHAASVKQAEAFQNHQLLWLLGGGLVVGGIILVATGNGHGAVGSSCPLPSCTPPTSTSTTTTTPTTTTTTTTTTTSTHT